MRSLLIMFVLALAPAAVFADYNEAVKLYRDGNYQEALKICAADLNIARDMEQNSPNYDIRFLAAHLHMKLGNTNSALAHLRRCMDIRKTAVEPYIDSALFAISKGMLNDAENTARQGLAVREDAMLYYVLGKIEYKRRNNQQAKTWFEKANQLNPELSMSYNDLGLVLIRLNRHSDANAAFSIASALAPDNSAIMNNLARSYELAGKKDKALDAYKKALSLDPKNAVIQKNLARLQ